MNQDPEPLVNSTQASKLFGVSPSYMSAIRRAMGLSGHYFFASTVRKFLLKHPNFRKKQVDHPQSCNCEKCLAKRARRAETKQQKLSLQAVAFKASDAIPAGPAGPADAAPGVVCGETTPELGVPTAATVDSATPEKETESAQPLAGTDVLGVDQSVRPLLPRTLRALMQKYQVSAKELTRRTERRGHKIVSSSFSRLLAGDQPYMSKRDLTLVAQALCPDPRDHFALCRARLIDELPTAFLSRLQIICTEDRPEGAVAHPFARLGPRSRATVRSLILSQPETFDALVQAMAAYVPPQAPGPNAPMRHLSTTLHELMGTNKLSAKKLTQRSAASGRKLGSPYLSRIINAQQTWIAADDLAALAEAVSADPIEQAHLVRARLYDECPPFAFPLLRIVLTGEDKSDAVVLCHLSRRGRKAFLHILHNAVQPEPVLAGLARLAGLN